MIPHNVALSVDETDQMSELLQAKFIQTMAGRCATQYPEVCGGCGTGEFGSAADRVELSWADRIVKPCRACRPADFAAYHAMIARHEESQDVGSTRPDECLEPETLALSSPQKPALSDDAPATLRTACNWCGSSECKAPVEHMVQLCGSDARWSLECAACHKCLTGGASYIALGVFAERHEAHGLACRWASPEFHGNRSRDDWDEHDDKSDILPNDKLTSYPWSER